MTAPRLEQARSDHDATETERLLHELREHLLQDLIAAAWLLQDPVIAHDALPPRTQALLASVCEALSDDADRVYAVIDTITRDDHATAEARANAPTPLFADQHRRPADRLLHHCSEQA